MLFPSTANEEGTPNGGQYFLIETATTAAAHTTTSKKKYIPVPVSRCVKGNWHGGWGQAFGSIRLPPYQRIENELKRESHSAVNSVTVDKPKKNIEIRTFASDGVQWAPIRI